MHIINCNQCSSLLIVRGEIKLRQTAHKQFPLLVYNRSLLQPPNMALLAVMTMSHCYNELCQVRVGGSTRPFLSQRHECQGNTAETKSSNAAENIS
jgi:hypothetical protein